MASSVRVGGLPAGAADSGCIGGRPVIVSMGRGCGGRITVGQPFGSTPLAGSPIWTRLLPEANTSTATHVDSKR
jgi:hypothetical protein